MQRYLEKSQRYGDIYAIVQIKSATVLKDYATVLVELIPK